MNLFTIDNQKVTYSPEALTIKEFKTLWDRDSSKHKEAATEELSYVFFLSDFKSPYMSYDKEARENKVISDVMSKKGWKADLKVKEACDKYEELQTTPSMGLLKDAECALDKIRHYFRNVDVTDDVEGTITKTLISNVEKLGGVIKGLSMLREMVDKEVSESKRMRGGGTQGLREKPKTR